MRKRKPAKKLVQMDLAAYGNINELAWQEWIEFRHASKKPVSRMAAERQLQMLAYYTPEIQAHIINTSIMNDWQGIFPPRGSVIPGSSRSTTLEHDLTDTSWAV